MTTGPFCFSNIFRENRRLVSLLIVGVVAAVSLLVFVLTIFAQTAPTGVTLLSNFDQTRASVTVTDLTTSSRNYDQSFITPASGSFKLEGFKVDVIATDSTGVTLDTITATVYKATTKSGNPSVGSALATKAISAGAAGVVTVTFDSALTLDADSRYLVNFVAANAADRLRAFSHSDVLDSDYTDSDSQPGFSFAGVWTKNGGTNYANVLNSYVYKIDFIGTPPAGIIIREPNTNPAKGKEISAAVNVVGTDNEDGYSKYGVVSSDDTCDPANNANVGFFDYTSGTTIILNLESRNGKKVCFLASDGTNAVSKLSAAIAGIDTTAPVLATPTQSNLTITTSATDENAPAGSTVTIQYVIIENALNACNATGYGQVSTKTTYPSTGVVVTSNNVGDRICFRAGDTAGNFSYKGIDVVSPLTITVTGDTDGSDPEQEKNITVTLSTTTGVTGTTWGLVSTAAACKSSSDSSLTTSYTASTSGTTITLSSESDNTKFACFKGVVSNTSYYGVSGAIAGIDRTAPTVTVHNPPTNPEQSKDVSAGDDDGGTDTWHYVEVEDSNCDATDFTGSPTVYTENRVIRLTAETDNGKRFCFRAVDVAGNAGYEISNEIAGIDRTPPDVTVTGPANTNPAQSKTVSAAISDNSETTTVYVEVSGSSDTCDNTVDFSSATDYDTEGADINFTAEANNDKKLCFRSTDQAGNIGYGISNLIDGIDTTDPVLSAIQVPHFLNAVSDDTGLVIEGLVTDKSLNENITISVKLTRTTGTVISTDDAGGFLTLSSGDTYDWEANFTGTDLAIVENDSAIAGVTIRVDIEIIDRAGNTTTDRTRTFIYDTNVPDTPTGLDLKTANDSCADVNTDGTCDYGTKTDNITSSRVLPVDMTLSSSDINNESSMKVLYYLNGTFTDVSSVLTNTSHTFTHTLASNAADGEYSFTSQALDAAGNVSPHSTPLVVTLDTTAPSAPAAPTLPAGDDTGASDSDRLTNKTNVTMGLGTIPANECYILLVDKGTGLNPVGTTCDTGAYTSDVGTSTNFGAGREFGIQSYDAAGNNTGRGNNTNTTYVRFDHLASEGVFDFLEDDTGWDTVDNITSDTTLTFAFDFFEYYTDTKLGNSFAADVALDVYRWVDSNTNGSWTDSELTLLYSVASTGSDRADKATVPNPFAEGVHRIVTKATDDAGNIAWTSAANVAYNPTTGVRGDNVIIIDTTEPAAPGEPDLNPTDDTFGTYPNRAKNGNDYDDITYDRSHDYFVDAAVRDSDDTADLTGHAKIMEQHHLHLYTYDGAAELVFDDENPSTGTTFPSSPSRHDGHLFTEAVTGLTNYYESNKTTARTSATQGELAQYDGSLWVRVGDLTALATNPGARTATNVTTADQFGKTAADTLSRTGKRFSKTFPSQSDTKRDVLIIATQTDAAGNVSAYSDAKIVVIDEDVPDRPTEDLFFHQGWDTGDSDTDKTTSSLSPLFFITDVVRDARTKAIIPDIDYYEIWRSEEGDDGVFVAPKYPSSATQPEQGSYNNPGDCNDGESQVDCRTRIQNLLINGGVPNPTYLDTYDNGVAVLIEAMSIMNLNRDYQFRMRAIDTAGNTSPAGDPNIITILSSPPKPVAPDLQAASDSSQVGLSGGGTDNITNQTTLSFDGSYSNLGAPEFSDVTSIPTFDVTKADYADGDAVVHLGDDGIQRAYLIEEDFTAAGATELLAKGTEVSAAQSVARVVTTFVPPTGSGLSATTVENSVSATTISAPTNANKGNGDYTYTATVNLIDVYGPTVPDGVWTVSSRAYNGAGEEGAPSDVFTFTLDRTAPTPQGTETDDTSLHAHLVYRDATNDSLAQRFFLKSVANKGVVEIYADEDGTTKLLSILEPANTSITPANSIYSNHPTAGEHASFTFDYFVKYTDQAGNSTEIIPMPDDAKPPLVTSYDIGNEAFQIIALPYGDNTIARIQKDATTLSIDTGVFICNVDRFQGSPIEIDDGSEENSAANDGIADALETVSRTGNNENELCVRAIDSSGNATYLRVRDAKVDLIANIRLGVVVDNTPDYTDDTGRSNEDYITSNTTPRITATTIPGVTGTIEYFRYRGSNWEILRVDPEDSGSAIRDFDNTTLTEITIDSHLDESGRLNLPALSTLQDGEYRMRAKVTIPGSPSAVTVNFPSFSIDTTPPLGAIFEDGTPTFAGTCPTRGDTNSDSVCDVTPVDQIAFSGAVIDDEGSTSANNQFIMTMYHNGTAIATDTVAKGDTSWGFVNDDMTTERDGSTKHAYEDGENSFTVTATDIAGNEGPQSAANTIIVDDTPPVVTIIKTSGAGGDTARTFIVVANDLTDTQADKSASTIADKTNCSGGTYAAHADTPLNGEQAAANEEYCYEVLDRAGNKSYAHTSEAVAGVGGITVDQDTGSSNEDLITSDSTLTLSGITAQNTEVRLYTKVNGETEWQRLFETQTITSAADGSVSVTLPTLQDGSHDIGSRIDVNGTFQPVDTPALAGTITVDTTAPSITGVDSFSINTTTNNLTYTIDITEGGTLSYTGTCNSFTGQTVAKGATTAVTENGIAEGKYQGCAITVTDTAGNRSQPFSLETIRTEDIVFEGPILTSDSGANADLNNDGTRDNQDRHTNTETGSFSISFETADIKTPPAASCAYAVATTDTAPNDNAFTAFTCAEGTSSFSAPLTAGDNYVFVKITDSGQTPATATQRIYTFLDIIIPSIVFSGIQKALPVTEGSLYQYSIALSSQNVDGVAITDLQSTVVAHSVTHPITVGIHEGRFSATDLVGNTASSPKQFVVLPKGLPLTETAVFTQNGPVDIFNSQTPTNTIFFDTDNDTYLHLPVSITPTYTYTNDQDYDKTKDAQAVTITTATITPTTEITICFNNNDLPNKTSSINVFVDNTKQENPTITKNGNHTCFTDDFAGGTTTVAMGGRKSGGVRAGGGGGGLGFTDFFFPQQQQEQQPTQTIIEPVITQEDTEQQQQKQQTLTRAITQGERSQYVLEAQQILNEKTDCKVATDGAGSQGQETTYLGTRTQQALRCFQQAAGLPVTGILTPATYQALISLTGQAVQVQPIQPTNNQPLYLQPSNQDPLPINPTPNRQPSLTQQQQVASFEESVLTGEITSGTRSQYVLEAQQILNTTTCQVATDGAGSPGQETNYLGSRTQQAIRCFQSLNNLTPTGTLTQETYETLISLTPIASVRSFEVTIPEEETPQQYFPDVNNQDPIPINPTVPLSPQFSTLGV